MKELRGDIWDAHSWGHWIVVTTNGSVRQDGACVMGRGVAREAALKFPKLPFVIGEQIRTRGNHVHRFDEFRIFSFPVKHVWMQTARAKLIIRSAEELRKLVDELGLSEVYSVRPGCGNGGFSWETIKPLIEPYFDDRFTIVERRP